MRMNKGFTLIELMIVVAIVAILASISYPSYQEHTRSAHRADAIGAIYSAVNTQEAWFNQNNAYSNNIDPFSSTATMPSPGGNYTISISTASDVYIITASPVAGYSDSACGNLTYKHNGTKGQSVASATVDQCWK